MPLDTATIAALGDLKTHLSQATAIVDALLVTPPPPPDEPPPDEPPPPPSVTHGIWRSPAELALLPTSGPAWVALLAAARGEWGSPKLSDLNNQHDVKTLGGALVAARLSDATLAARVVAACRSAVGTEAGSRSLEVSRNITCYVLAADLVGMVDPAWSAWLDELRTRQFDGKTIISTHEDRPNNWGTMAGAARAAIARYLDDTADLERCATVFRGWLGDRATYAGFSYGELSWQADPQHPVGINPRGANKDGHDIDGVLPDDQRRGGSFTWPPPKEGYAWESLQGVVVQAEILHRAGYDVWQWSDQAILRAYEWLHDICQFPATGDDAGFPHIVNKAYGSTFPAATPAPIGKNMGWMDWVFA